MAQKSSSKKKNTSAKNASSKKNNARAPKPSVAKTEDKTGRIVWGIFFLLFSACIFVSYFVNDGVLISGFSRGLRGVLGYGYLTSAVCYLIIFYILCFSESKNYIFRIINALLLPVFFSAAVHLYNYGAETYLNCIDKYFELGNTLESGGVLGSLVSYVTNLLLGKIGGLIILFIILIIQLLIILGVNKDTFSFQEKGSDDKIKDLKQAYAPQVKQINVKKTVQPELKPVSATKKTINTKPHDSGWDIPLGEDSESIDTLSRNTKKSTKTPRKVVPVTISETRDDLLDNENKSIRKTSRMKPEELKHETEIVQQEVKNSDENSSGTYVYPLTSLLTYGTDRGSDSKDEILATKERLENTLHSFGVNSYVVNITPGPTVTRYDIELEQGVKLAKVTNLSGDIALSLGALNVRVAPIPDEISTVGIEVPNKIVNTVSLREIIESDNFKKAKSKLTFAIGKDIGGNAIVGNISKLPHMLIAGTTGSGKSVCMNSLIISLLYKARPDEVKFIMIDPKMVELGIYNSIPHLYVPVVTDPKKAAGALQWTVVEMLKRYRLFSDAGVRDLESYNSYCKSNQEEQLPQVVIVIDELADLMMAASKEVEESICRVAQMGRAAGMHLIIATQRPSSDVITGLMKANIPSRIAFAVSSAMESRIIMDTAGAEKLVGMGDMLYSPLGSGKPLRVQGSYISDSDREKVIDFIKENCDIVSEKNSDLEDAMNQATSSDNDSKSDEKQVSNEYDEVLPQAVEIVLEQKSCSVSMLQRRLKLGYSRAARVVDQMEELGVVGPYEGAKPRSVRVDKEGWHNIQIELGMADDDYALADQLSDLSDEGFNYNDE